MRAEILLDENHAGFARRGRRHRRAAEGHGRQDGRIGGKPLHQQLAAMQLYKPEESGEGVVFKLQRTNTQDGLSDFTVRRLAIGQPNYAASKCCPVVPIELTVREQEMSTGCCDNEYTPCYSEFTPPAPGLTLVGGDDVRIAFDTTTELPIPDGYIPLNCWVDISYRRVGTSTWSVLSNQSATLLDPYLTISNFVTGHSYEFYIVCKNYNDSDCNSQNGELAEIAIP